MSSVLLFVFSIIMFCSLEIVLCQVCVETRLEWRDVPETYLYTYMEAYEKSNCLFWCTDSRVATATGTRNVRKRIPENINVCCDGYLKNEHSNDNSIHCLPSCTPECKNGYCKSPGECACQPGYIPDISDPHNCLPLCLDGCNNGTCIAPDICQCNSGYRSNNGKCEPVCTEPCQNGVCVAPDTCMCHPGYHKTDNNTCELHCSSYTEDGECIFTFTCEEGWTKVSTGDVDICEPICENQCVNGFCIAPDTCECFQGYEYSENNKCEPFCSSGCPHGSCVGPETCVCDPGWFRKGKSDECYPHCDQQCGNGTCIAPDVCECFLGYKLRDNLSLEVITLPVCEPICRECEGTCIAPSQCVCEDGQETKHLTVDGGPCNCYDNCSDWRYQCAKTVCEQLKVSPDIVSDVIVSNGRTESEESTSTNTNVDYDGATNRNDGYYYQKTIEKASWFSSQWIYGMLAVLITVFIIIFIGAVLKKKYKSISKNILFNRDASSKEPSTVTVHYKQNSMP